MERPPPEPGILIMVNGRAKRLSMLGVSQTALHTLPVWTVEIDTSLGCAGSLEDAILMAARASEVAPFPLEKQ